MRRHKIEILQEESTTNLNGYKIKEWVALAPPLWARVKDLAGREYYAANAEQRAKTIMCNISYRTDVTTGMRVRFKNEVYNIKRIYSGTYKKIDLNIDCELIEGVTD